MASVGRHQILGKSHKASLGTSQVVIHENKLKGPVAAGCASVWLDVTLCFCVFAAPGTPTDANMRIEFQQAGRTIYRRQNCFIAHYGELCAMSALVLDANSGNNFRIQMLSSSLFTHTAGWRTKLKRTTWPRGVCVCALRLGARKELALIYKPNDATGCDS